MKLEKKLEDAIDKLSRSETNPDEFKIWLKSFLITNISHPLPRFSFNEYPYEYLYRINERTENVRFQERLRHAVKDLFKDWNVNARITESIEYYSSLLNLIAELPVSEMYPELIETALTGFYCGVFSENEDIEVQILILQVIAGMQIPVDEKIKGRLMDLVKRYILESRYTPLCFRIAWQTRIESVIHYIKPLLECLSNRRFDIHGTIERFLSGSGIAEFKNLLVPMMEQLHTNNMVGHFLKILFKLGVKIRATKFRFYPSDLLLIWELYGHPVSRTRISCDNAKIMNQIKHLSPLETDAQKIIEKDNYVLKSIVEISTSKFSYDPETEVLGAQI